MVFELIAQTLLAAMLLGGNIECLTADDVRQTLDSFYKGQANCSQSIEKINQWKYGCMCSDGSADGQCSVQRPWHCLNGTLVEDCATCGCEDNHACSANGSCLLSSCTDGTLLEHCAAGTPPVYCTKQGVLVNNCTICGCPQSIPQCTQEGYCTAGQTCVDLCTKPGITECVNSSAYALCADHDNDGCLELGPAASCISGQNCYNGSCRNATGTQIGLFAINEGNFNQFQGVRSYFCCNQCTPAPSFDSFNRTVTNDGLVNQSKIFISGWSCGATYALIFGLQNSARVEGIIHINQASIPTYQTLVENAWNAGGQVKVPVYIVHDFSYDPGGTYLKNFLVSKGYTIGVDLFIMDRPGTGHTPYLTTAQKQTIYEWMNTR